MHEQQLRHFPTRTTVLKTEVHKYYTLCIEVFQDVVTK